MQILANNGGIAQTNTYLIADEATKEAVLFDAPDNTTEELIDEAIQRGWNVIGLWLTHGHFDHIADHEVIKRKCPNAKILIHPLDEPMLVKPRTGMFHLPLVIPPGKADELVKDGQELKIGTMKLVVMHTPGHSPGHVMYYFPEQKILVGGDLIIMGGVGRTDFPESNPADLVTSIQKVMALPPDTQLLPGHGEPSRLADEAEYNSSVREALEPGAGSGFGL